MPKSLLNQQRSRLLVALFALLASVYMITYSARIESSDTLPYLKANDGFFNSLCFAGNAAEYANLAW